MEQQMMTNNNNTAILGPERKPLPASPSSSSSSISSSLGSDSDPFEEVTSSSSSSTDQPPPNNDPALDMSSLVHQLPIKRGLSKHYEGKSQSFTSLANVRSLQDLAKPEHPYNKRLKMKSLRRSYGAGMVGDTMDGGISKGSRVSCSSMNVKRATSSNTGISNRPPMPVRRSSTTTNAAAAANANNNTAITNQTPLFA